MKRVIYRHMNNIGRFK